MAGKLTDRNPFKDFGGWPTYVPPKNNVARLVQMPAHQVDGYLLADAYMRDERSGRTAREDKHG